LSEEMKEEAVFWKTDFWTEFLGRKLVFWIGVFSL